MLASMAQIFHFDDDDDSCGSEDYDGLSPFSIDRVSSESYCSRRSPGYVRKDSHHDDIPLFPLMIDKENNFEIDNDAYGLLDAGIEDLSDRLDIELKLDNEVYGTPGEIRIVEIDNVDLVSPGPNSVPTDSFFSQDGRSDDTNHSSSQSNSLCKASLADFQFLNVLGKGAYGKVFLVKKLTGIDKDHYYAMKVLRKAHIVLHEKDTEHTKTERSILEEVRHPFIVRLFYAFQTEMKLYLILDYAPGGELFTYLDKEKMLLEDRAVFYMAELVLAMEHLHKLGIIYRDLKPENVLLDGEGWLSGFLNVVKTPGHIKLTDFGLSKVALNGDGRTNTVCGTVEYMAPEVLANQPYDKTVDWWSLGAMSFDLLTGQPPFTSNNRKKTIDMIMNKKLVLPFYISPDGKNLLTCLLRKKPNARLGFGPADAVPVKQHRFFKKIDWKKLFDRQLTPPLKPRVTSPEDVANFHKDFTSMPAIDSPTDSSGHVLGNQFPGFSYVGESILDSQFEGYYRKESSMFTNIQSIKEK